jgi:NADH-quinone oxidoreductase subunit N
MLQASLLLEISPERIETIRGLFDAIVESLGHFGPEMQVAIAALAVFLIDLFLPLRASKHLAWVALAGCLLPALSVSILGPPEQSLFLGMIAIDSYANFFKVFFLLGAVPVIILSYLSLQLEGRRMGEYYGILLASVFGAILMASSTHFLMLFMSLELLSICSYVLVGYLRTDKRSAEASLKYIIYGSVAAGILAYGLSLLYGLTGSADIASLAAVLWNSEHEVWTARALEARTAIALTFGLVLVFAGIAYKMSTIPMHFWAPDVYEGAPTPVTAFLSVLSKAAGFALALRFLSQVPGGAEKLAAVWRLVPWNELMIVVSILTMTLGNLAALWQTNLKRLLAYSSIAHAGYMLMGLTILESPEVGGIQAVLFYLCAYLAMNFGAFAVIILVENRLGSVDLEGYRGLGRQAPFLSAALTIFIFSLIGIPPTAGFTGKWQLFMGVLDMARPEYYLLAVAAAVNTAVSAYYYLKIVREMYMAEGRGAERMVSPMLGNLLVVAMVAMTFYLFFRAEAVLDVTSQLKLHP